MNPSTRSVVEGFLAALNEGDPDAVVEWVTEDFFNEHTSLRASSLRGRAAYRQRLPSFLAQFAGLHYEVEAFLVDGAQAAVAYEMTFSWQPADSQAAPVPVAIRGMFRFLVTSGQIAHRVDYWDSAQFDVQIAAND